MGKQIQIRKGTKKPKPIIPKAGQILQKGTK